MNVGYGEETTFNAVVDIINEELETRLDPVYVPVPIQIYAERLWADMAKTKSVLGFQPAISVREGIRRVIDFSRSLPNARELSDMQHYYLTLPFLKTIAKQMESK